MLKKLSRFSAGESGIIKRVAGEGRVRRRLFDMGVTPGTEITMKKRAPFGDPIEVILRGYFLSLRNSEAACVEVEV